MDAEQQELLKKIEARARHDRFWGKMNLYYAQTLACVGILASFASSIAAATGRLPGLFTAAAAAIPGCVIVLDKSFNFMRVSRWHFLLAARMDALSHALRFEQVSTTYVSRRFSDLLTHFEERVPPFNVGGWSDTERTEKDD